MIWANIHWRANHGGSGDGSPPHRDALGTVRASLLWQCDRTTCEVAIAPVEGGGCLQLGRGTPHDAPYLRAGCAHRCAAHGARRLNRDSRDARARGVLRSLDASRSLTVGVVGRGGREFEARVRRLGSLARSLRDRDPRHLVHDARGGI